MSSRWREYTLSLDGSHHVHRGRSAYASRFLEVLKLHVSGAYHITPEGEPVYEARYLRTFGFYEDRAVVHSHEGWFHELPDGSPL